MRILLESPFWRMLAGATLISFAPVFTTVSGVSAQTSAFYRVFFGALVLLLWIIARRQSFWPGLAVARIMLLAAVFFALDLALWHRSILIVGPGLATLLANLQVFVMPLVAVFLFREHLRPAYFLGAALAMLGLWLQIGIGWESFGSNYQMGIILGILTAVAYTGFMLSLKRADAINASGLLVLSAFCALLLGLFSVANGDSFVIPSIQSGAVLVAYGGLCQVLGWFLIAGAIKKLSVVNVGLLLLLQPTLAMIWDMMFFQRSLTLLAVAGAILTLLGILVGSTYKKNVNGTG